MRPNPILPSLFVALLLLTPQGLRAGGSSEGERPSEGLPQGALTQATVQAYWLLEEGAANASLLLERLYLPTSLSVLRWTEFTTSDGGVELVSTGGYRVVRKEPNLTEAWNGMVLHGYAVRIDFVGQADPPARSSRRIGVRFAYDSVRPAGRGGAGGGDGDAAGGAAGVPQPLQQALLKGIEASGESSGLARVLELRYEGKGRFSAQIEVQ